MGNIRLPRECLIIYRYIWYLQSTHTLTTLLKCILTSILYTSKCEQYNRYISNKRIYINLSTLYYIKTPTNQNRSL